MRRLINRFINKLGIDLVRFHHPTPFNFYTYVLGKIDTGLILDVGGNTGQFGQSIRSRGWTGAMISFEPLRQEYLELSNRASHDPEWEAFNFAIGDKDEQKQIHVAQNSQSSSFLDVASLPLDGGNAIRSDFATTVSIKRLDTAMETFAFDKTKRWLLKLDVQGYEPQVLSGANRALGHVHAIQCELVVTPTYSGQLNMHEMWDLLRGHGFSLFHILDGYRHPETGDMLEFDGLFIRKEHITLF